MSEAAEGAVAEQALGGDEAPALNEVEKLASELGWKPKSDYSGPEERWRPADEFIRRTTTDRDLRRDMKRLTTQIDKMAAASSKSIERALNEQQQRLQAEFEAAVEKGDKKGAVDAVNELQKLQADHAPASSDNVEKDFAARNPWYGKDDEATDYAISVSNRLARQGKSIEEQLDGVEVAMKKRFPDLFEKKEAAPQERKPLAVATPSRAGGGKSEAYGDLPPHAKSACDGMAEAAYSRFGGNGDKDKFLGTFRKNYAKDYHAG
jgi:hypothetical protein